MSELTPSRVGAIRLLPMRDEVRFVCGSQNQPLRFLKFADLRSLADALHDLADHIERKEREQ